MPSCETQRQNTNVEGSLRGGDVCAGAATGPGEGAGGWGGSEMPPGVGAATMTACRVAEGRGGCLGGTRGPEAGASVYAMSPASVHPADEKPQAGATGTTRGEGVCARAGLSCTHFGFGSGVSILPASPRYRKIVLPLVSVVYRHTCVVGSLYLGSQVTVDRRVVRPVMGVFVRTIYGLFSSHWYLSNAVGQLCI